ncbi:hypothetical protein N9937_01045 [bacterium]|nr:hypothetical protein [bacterium]
MGAWYEVKWLGGQCYIEHCSAATEWQTEVFHVSIQQAEAMEEFFATQEQINSDFLRAITEND